MDIVTRLIEFKDSTGLTSSQFADKAEIARPTLSQFVNGRNKRLSDELIAKLHTAFPELNISWLLFGEGEMTSAHADDRVAEEVPEMRVTEPSGDGETSTEDGAQSDVQKPREAVNTDREVTATATQNIHSVMHVIPPVSANPERKIKSIMVFYTDNSYETFTPRD